MSDLQIGLILLGGLLILGVLLFNWWQDRRIRRRMQDHFPEGEQDPLMGAASADGSARKEPGFTTWAIESDNNDGPPTDDVEEVDPTIEAVIDINFAKPIDSVELHGAVQGLTAAGNKPVRLFATSDAGLHRARLRPGESYITLQLALLLANRSGPLTEIEWSTVWTRAERIAHQFDGAIEAPEISATLDRGRHLDAICADLDAQVGLIIHLAQPQAVTSVLPAFERMGFTQTSAHLIYPTQAGLPQFYVAFEGEPVPQLDKDEVQRIDFVLDLPNSVASQEAFSQMAILGQHLAKTLGGQLLDDQGQAVSEPSYAVVDQQLYSLYERLEQAGFPAGAPRTRRVFSG